MDRKKVSAWIIVLVLLLMSACSTPQPTVPPPTATSAPTATPEPPTATPEPPVWDYVALGDSFVALASTYGYTNHYAAYLEADLGVKVIQNNKGISGMQSGELLDRIRNDQAWRKAISEAEVVTVYIGGNDVGYQLIGEYKFGKCGGDDNMDCIRKAYETFKANYDAILDELLTLCAPGAIIRVATCPYGSLRAYGYSGETTSFLKPLNEQIIQSAAEHNIPLARVDIAFNGLTGDENAEDKEYFRDGWHPSILGATIMADAHRELGYEPIQR